MSFRQKCVMAVVVASVAACGSKQTSSTTDGVRAPDRPASEVEAVDNLPTLPGATVIGLGYDPTEERVFRNRVLAADLDVAPVAWAAPEQGGFYYYAETDRRYLVPKHVVLLPQHQRSEVEYTIAESKSSFARKVSAHVKASGGYGLFSASVEGSFDSSTRSESESMYAQRTERIYLWSVWLTPTHELDAAFSQRIEALPVEVSPATRAAYQSVIDDYGVAVVSYAALGGRLDYNQTMTKNAHQSERDIKLSVSASYGSFFHGSASASTSTQQSSSSSQTDTSVEVFGGNVAEAALLMEKGGDLVPWSVSVPKDPAVVDVEVIDLWKLVVPGPRRDELERAVYRHGRSANPSVELRIQGGPLPQIYLDDGDLIDSDQYPERASAEHMRVTVLDARNLHVRDDRYFYSLPGGSTTSTSGASVLRSAGCNGCQQCADFVEDTAVKRKYGDDALKTLQTANPDDWMHRFSEPQRQECIRVLQTYTPPGSSGGGTYPPLADIKAYLSAIAPHELVIITTFGNTGALQLRKDVQAELRALGAKATPASGPYILIGSRGANSYEMTTPLAGTFRALLLDDANVDRYNLAMIGSVPIAGQ